MKIEKLRVKNFKVYQDTEIKSLPNLCVFLGANGSGKSTLFDVFGFLSDALKSDVKTALNKRGGYKEVYYKNGSGPIEFEIKFRNPTIEGKQQPLITYELAIDVEKNSTVIFISKEILSYRRGKHGKAFQFLKFAKGEGFAITNEEEFEVDKQEFNEQREVQTLDNQTILALKGLGQFQKFKAISSFRRLLDNWYVSNFQIQAAQTVEDTGLSEHLSTTGNNLAQVTKYIYENHPETFQLILDKMKLRVPGIEKVEATETEDGRIVLKFRDGSFKDPFISRFVSDGTIKMFAYLILINDPSPHPLLCIEEPENYLHYDLLLELAEEFREYANKGGQVFISTHSPDFVNALKLPELFWLSKNEGHTSIKRASDDENVVNLFNEGEPLGALWKQGYLMGSGPRN